MLDDIEKFIDDYIKTPSQNTKTYGEVFTPPILINKMLDLLPIDIWSNKNYRFGDFCVGIGNFTIHIIKRLMIGLEHNIPNEEERYRYIIENMIYVGDIQEENYVIFNSIFNPDGKYKINFYRGSFFYMHSNIYILILS